MTVLNPPGFLQNAGATHTAEQMRNWFGALVGGKVSSTSLIARGGVRFDLGNALQVTQAGSPAMSVVVKSGVASVPGSEASKQGVYMVANDADVTLTISAAHATLNRLDLICFKVEDSGYSGVANTSSLVVVIGTPAASPSLPAAPANSITLASVSIVANDTSITTGEITDRRSYMTATGGRIICVSTARPAAGTVGDGQVIYETDTDRTYITHDGGTTWSSTTANYRARQTMTGTQATITFTGIPSGLRKLTVSWTARTTEAGSSSLLGVRVNNDSGANYSAEFTFVVGNATPASLNDPGAAQWRAGRPAGSTATAGVYGVGEIDLIGWDSPHSLYLGMISNSGTISGGGVVEDSRGAYHAAGPYIRLDFFVIGGSSFVVGTDFQLEGIYA